MKRFAKSLVLHQLERLAAWRIRKIRPELIGITGSVGKTSVKEACARVLSAVGPTLSPPKSLNTEFGAMLAVLEQDSGYSSLTGWVRVLWKGFWSTLFLRGRPYRFLILEMGADKPGDIHYLVKRLHPTIGILTNVKAVHMAEGQFPSVEAIFNEKSALIQSLTNEELALLNEDDPRVKGLADAMEGRCRVIRFGTAKTAQVRASAIHSSPEGLTFTVTFGRETERVRCRYLLGEHHVYVVLPALALGLAKGLTLAQCAEVIREFRLPPGRMTPIPGQQGSLLLDSSYNASPEAVLGALEVLKSMPGRRIAALGSMNELGTRSRSEHTRIGKAVPAHADRLVTVGKEARAIATAARKAGMKASHVHSFDTSLEAADFLLTQLKKGDVVLAKGSQNNVRMEHLVKRLMAHPEHAALLLPRQDAYWQSHP